MRKVDRRNERITDLQVGTLGISEIGARIFEHLWGLGTEWEQGCLTGPPGYTGWRNRFLENESWAP
jgi:hypothetical protein